MSSGIWFVAITIVVDRNHMAAGWGSKWRANFSAGETQITLLPFLWKWMDLSMNKNNNLSCWGCLSPLNWIGALKLSLLLKLPAGKLQLWFVLWSYFLLRLSFFSINLAHNVDWILLLCLRLYSEMLLRYNGGATET